VVPRPLKRWRGVCTYPYIQGLDCVDTKIECRGRDATGLEIVKEVAQPTETAAALQAFVG